MGIRMSYRIYLAAFVAILLLSNVLGAGKVATIELPGIGALGDHLHSPAGEDACQSLAHDDRVDRAVLLVQLHEAVEDDLVVGLEQVLAPADLHDLPDQLLGGRSLRCGLQGDVRHALHRDVARGVGEGAAVGAR